MQINSSEFNQFVKDIKSKIYSAKSKLPDELMNALPTRNELKEIIQRD